MSDDGPERRFRTLFISDVHLGARGSQAASAARFPPRPRRRYDLSGRRHRRRLGAANRAGTGRSRTTTSSRSCCARRARARASSTFPAITTSSCASTTARISAASRSSESAIHDRRRRPPLSGHPRRHVRPRGAATRAGSPMLGDKAYDLAIRLNRIVNALRRWLGVPYWSLSQWAKLKVKNAVNYIGAFEQTLAQRSAPPRRRRRDLRPHPHRRDPRRSRHPLHELRRLGRELHGARRA